MKLAVLWNLMVLFCSASSELYSSAVGLEKLIKTEKSFIEIYQSLVIKAEQQIVELKREIERLEKEHEKTKTFTSNPFNNFHLTRRILKDWIDVENILSDQFLQEAKKNLTELKSCADFPSERDLAGSADAILLISDTYSVEINSLANGIVDGIQYPSRLSADDCYWIGVQSYLSDDFHRAYSWMDEALKRFLKEENPANPDVIEKALEIAAYSAYQLGDLSRALNITIESLKRYPNNSQAPANIEYYVYLLKNNQAPRPKERIQADWEIKFGDICRKAITPAVEISSQLKCRYVDNGVPFLRLAPIKEEEAFLNPRVLLFRDVLYDPEIELLKELAIPKLESALVVDGKGGDVFSKSRVAQMSWIDSNEHPMLSTILQRAEDMTKLDPSRSEGFQVVNYGVGGHYKPHFDSLEDSGMPFMENGDRIATLLYYMSDVEEGGATVFTKLNMGVWPKKGTAVLWYNLTPDGNKKDERTMHGACPVVAGTKWICTIWFNSKGQEFRRPCELRQ